MKRLLLLSMVIAVLLLVSSQFALADDSVISGGGTGLGGFPDYSSGGSVVSSWVTSNGVGGSGSGSSSSGSSGGGGTSVVSGSSTDTFTDDMKSLRDSITNIPGSIENATANGFKNGVSMVLRAGADYVFGLAGATENTANDVLTNVTASHEDYLGASTVKNTMGFSQFWFLFFWIMFVIVGAMIVLWHEHEPLPKTGFGYLDNHLTGELYVKTALLGLVIYMFATMGMQFLFNLEWVLTYTAVHTGLSGGGVAAVGGAAVTGVSLIPDIAAGAPAALAFAFVFIVSILFFVVRSIVITLAVAYFLPLAGASLFPFVRGYVLPILEYALILLFARPVVDVLIINGIKLASIIPIVSYIPGVSVIPFLAIGIFIAIVEIAILLAPFTIMKFVRSGVTKIVMAVA
jgi:hypothetical protein